MRDADALNRRMSIDAATRDNGCLELAVGRGARAGARR